MDRYIIWFAFLLIAIALIMLIDSAGWNIYYQPSEVRTTQVY